MKGSSTNGAPVIVESGNDHGDDGDVQYRAPTTLGEKSWLLSDVGYGIEIALLCILLRTVKPELLYRRNPLDNKLPYWPFLEKSWEVL